MRGYSEREMEEQREERRRLVDAAAVKLTLLPTGGVFFVLGGIEQRMRQGDGLTARDFAAIVDSAASVFANNPQPEVPRDA